MLLLISISVFLSRNKNIFLHTDLRREKLEKHLKGHNENYSTHLTDKISQICSEVDHGYGDPIEVTKATIAIL